MKKYLLQISVILGISVVFVACVPENTHLTQDIVDINQSPKVEDNIRSSPLFSTPEEKQSLPLASKKHVLKSEHYQAQLLAKGMIPLDLFQDNQSEYFKNMVVSFAEESLYPGFLPDTEDDAFQQVVSPILKSWDENAIKIEVTASGDTNWKFSFASDGLKETLVIDVAEEWTRVYRYVWGNVVIDRSHVRLQTDEIFNLAYQAFENKTTPSHIALFPSDPLKIQGDVLYKSSLELVSFNQRDNLSRYFVVFNVPDYYMIPGLTVPDISVEEVAVFNGKSLEMPDNLKPRKLDYFYGAVAIDAESGAILELSRPVKYHQPYPVPASVVHPAGTQYIPELSVIRGHIFDESSHFVDNVTLAYEVNQTPFFLKGKTQTFQNIYLLDRIPIMKVRITALKDGYTARSRWIQVTKGLYVGQNEFDFGSGEIENKYSDDRLGGDFFLSSRPEVMNTKPVHGSEMVSPRVTIQLTFSELVQPQTVEKHIQLLAHGEVIADRETMDFNWVVKRIEDVKTVNVLKIKVKDSLPFNTQITLDIGTNAIKDLVGNTAMENEFYIESDGDNPYLKHENMTIPKIQFYTATQ